jgi:acetyltransferase-like isoleucine patch superfamily enzyme
MKKTIYISTKEMKSPKNKILHGVYLSFYGFFKYWSFPFSNYLRFIILKVFMKKLNSNYISDGTSFWFPWEISIGYNSSINQGCNLHGLGGIEIGNNVRIACYTTIFAADHEFSNPDTPVRHQGYRAAKVTIEDDVWIGAGVNINKGVTIGKGAVIGGGSVVTKDIPPYAVAVGNPARVIKYRNENQVNNQIKNE